MSTDNCVGFLKIVDESRTARGPDIRTTKGRRSRQLPITKDLRAVLDRLASRRAEGRVFRAERGGQLRERNVLQAFIDKVSEPLKERFPELDVNEKSFADGRLHSFRHYFCSRCANQGVSELALKQWLGHTSSVMIARYYHLHDDEAQRQIGKLGSLMNRPAM